MTAKYRTASQLIKTAITSPSWPSRPGRTWCATRCVAFAYSRKETRVLLASSESAASMTQGRSGLRCAWKSTKPGTTVNEPSRGGEGTVLEVPPITINPGTSVSQERKEREQILTKCRVAVIITDDSLPPVVLREEGCELQCGGASEAQCIIGHREGLRFPGTSQRLLLFPPRPFRQTSRRTVLLQTGSSVRQSA